MTTLISEFFSTVFRPSMAALLIVGGISILSIDDKQIVGGNDIQIASVGCGGIISPLCDFIGALR